MQQGRPGFKNFRYSRQENVLQAMTGSDAALEASPDFETTASFI